LLSVRERIIVKKETQLAERDRLIAVRDAELYAKTRRSSISRRSSRCCGDAVWPPSEKLDREIEQLETLLGELGEVAAESNARAVQAEQDPASRGGPRRGITSRPAASCCRRTCRANT
jgi:hypothetical protein